MFSFRSRNWTSAPVSAPPETRIPSCPCSSIRRQAWPVIRKLKQIFNLDLSFSLVNPQISLLLNCCFRKQNNHRISPLEGQPIAPTVLIRYPRVGLTRELQPTNSPQWSARQNHWQEQHKNWKYLKENV